MSRRSAEDAMREMHGRTLLGMEITIDWGKAITLPQQPVWPPPEGEDEPIQLTIPKPANAKPTPAAPPMEEPHPRLPDVKVCYTRLFYPIALFSQALRPALHCERRLSRQATVGSERRSTRWLHTLLKTALHWRKQSKSERVTTLASPSSSMTPRPSMCTSDGVSSHTRKAIATTSGGLSHSRCVSMAPAGFRQICPARERRRRGACTP